MSAFTPSDDLSTMAQPILPEENLEMQSMFSHPEGLSAAKALVWELWLKSLTEPVDYCQVVVPATVLERLAFRNPQAHLTGQNHGGGGGIEQECAPGSPETSDISHVKLGVFVPTSTSEQQNVSSSSDLEILPPAQRTNSPRSAPSATFCQEPLLQIQSRGSTTASTRFPFDDPMELDSAPVDSLMPGRRPLLSPPAFESTNAAANTLYSMKWSGLAKTGQQSNSLLPTLQPRLFNDICSPRLATTSTSSSLVQQVRQLAPAPLPPNRSLSQHLSARNQSPILALEESDNREILHVEEEPRNSLAITATRPYPQIACRAEDSPDPESAAAVNLLLTKKSGRKRKGEEDGINIAKKARRQAIESQKPKRVPKPKIEKTKKEPARLQLSQDIWMRILEFTPPSFLAKARRISKIFKGYVDDYNSISKNNRQENFGCDMPDAQVLGLSERQYCNLLYGSKGCLEPGCSDKKAVRTHWSWTKRWCHDCWKKKIEREDKVFKTRNYTRVTLTKMLECLPMGMHDSFMKPHDIVTDITVRPRGAPRLYKYYLIEDLDQITAEYDALTPKPYVPDPAHSPEEKAAALSTYQTLTANLESRRAELLDVRKAKNDKHMDLVRKIEAGIRWRREKHAGPNAANRDQRKELFTRRAREELFSSSPGMDEAFVRSTAAFKQATRISRDGGTERGWNALKPKIIKEWEDKDLVTAASAKTRVGGEISRFGSVENDSLFGDCIPSHSQTPAPFGEGQPGHTLDYFTQKTSHGKLVAQQSDQAPDYSSSFGQETNITDSRAQRSGQATNLFSNSNFNQESHITNPEAQYLRQVSNSSTNLTPTAASVAAMFRDYQLRHKLDHAGNFSDGSYDTAPEGQQSGQALIRYDISQASYDLAPGAQSFGQAQIRSVNNDQESHSTILGVQNLSSQYVNQPLHQPTVELQSTLGYGNGLAPPSNHTYSHNKAPNTPQSMLPPVGNFLSHPFDDFNLGKRQFSQSQPMASNHVQLTFTDQGHFPSTAETTNYGLPPINVRQSPDEQMKATSGPRDDRLKISSLISAPSPQPYEFQASNSQNTLQHQSYSSYNNYDYFSQGPL